MHGTQPKVTRTTVAKQIKIKTVFVDGCAWLYAQNWDHTHNLVNVIFEKKSILLFQLLPLSFNGLPQWALLSTVHVDSKVPMPNGWRNLPIRIQRDLNPAQSAHGILKVLKIHSSLPPPPPPSMSVSHRDLFYYNLYIDVNIVYAACAVCTHNKPIFLADLMALPKRNLTNVGYRLSLNAYVLYGRLGNVRERDMTT